MGATNVSPPLLSQFFVRLRSLYHPLKNNQSIQGHPVYHRYTGYAALKEKMVPTTVRPSTFPLYDQFDVVLTSLDYENIFAMVTEISEEYRSLPFDFKIILSVMFSHPCTLGRQLFFTFVKMFER